MTRHFQSNRFPVADPRRQRGVVMVMTLLGMLLLIALVAFVINLGSQVNRRIEAQNLADATAQAAATWTARSMNTVAMNNVRMAHNIALINVLDAMPQAAFNVENETRAFHDRLEEQLGSGIPAGDPELRAEVERQYNGMLAALAQTLEEVEPVAALFDEIDVRDLTHYQRDGALWQQLRAMDELNRSLVASVGDVAHHAADRTGRFNANGSDPSRIALLPLEPDLPVERGQFDDFLRPVVNGLLPADIDDKRTNRGPWDTVFGWRHLQTEHQGGRRVPTGESVAEGGRGNTPASGGVGGGGGYRTIGGETVVTGYSTYGPRRWYLDRVRSFNRNHMPHTRLSMWVKEISEIKLKRLWPSVSIQFNHFHNTEWITSYEEAKQIATEYHETRQLPRVLQTAYFVLEIKSKHEINDPRFMDNGTWRVVDRHNHPEPRIVYLAPQNGSNHGTGHGPWAGWYDAAEWGITKLNNHAWRDDWDYEVFWDHEIDIDPRYNITRDAEGNIVERDPIPQPVYRYDFFVFAGANIDWDKRPENPWDGFDRNAPDAPAPMNLDHAVMTPDDVNARFEHLKFLAMAWYGDEAQTWPTRFHDDRPVPGVMAMAQAKVFNNHSWDLWTQMWHARLEPVTNANGAAGIDDWIASMEGDQIPETISESGADTLHALLESLAPMAPATLAH